MEELEKGRGRYSVEYEPIEDGWWLATVLDVDGCFTQGKSLRQTRRRVREALGLFVDDAETAGFEESFALPKAMGSNLDEYLGLRDEARKASLLVQTRGQKLARVLERKGISTRDAAELMGISQQRVSQLRQA